MTDTAKYAEGLRASLLADLFAGEAVDLDDEDDTATAAAAGHHPGEDGGGFTVEDYIGSTTDSLQDVEADLEAFAQHEVIKGACVLSRLGLGQSPLSHGSSHAGQQRRDFHAGQHKHLSHAGVKGGRCAGGEIMPPEMWS